MCNAQLLALDGDDSLEFFRELCREGRRGLFPEEPHSRVYECTCCGETFEAICLPYHLFKSLTLSVEAIAMNHAWFYWNEQDENDDDVAEFLDKLGFEHTAAYNTYNFDNNLDQHMRYWLVDADNSEGLVFVSVHNGGDIRGGYTTPICFKYSDWFDVGFLDLWLKSELG